MNLTKNNLKIGSESGSDGMFGTGLGVLSCGFIFNLGVTLSADES